MEMRQFNALVFQESEWYVGQTIEYDIVVQAESPEKAIRELSRALTAHIDIALSKNTEPFQGLQAPPAKVVQAWNDAVLVLSVRSAELGNLDNLREIRFCDSLPDDPPPPLTSDEQKVYDEIAKRGDEGMSFSELRQSSILDPVKVACVVPLLVKDRRVDAFYVFRGKVLRDPSAIIEAFRVESEMDPLTMRYAVRR